MHLLERRRLLWMLAPIIGLGLLAAGIPLRAGATSLAVSTTSLTNAEVGSPYSQTLTATDGTSPYNWAITVGTLPAGLSLDSSTGAISGTPTTLGTSSFTAQVTDSAANAVTAALSITVNPAISITTASLPNGELGSVYSQTLAATGGIAPYTWSISVGALPTGLSINGSTGVVSGTPTTVGTFSFSAMVTDSVAHSSTMGLSIVINDNLAVTTVSLANGSLGVPYSQTLTAVGGVAPFTWSIAVGTLPAGLSLSSAGVVSGTPTGTGTSTFTVMVTDGVARSAVYELSITINSGNSGLTLATTSLPGGTVGTPYAQSLTAVGGVAPYSWAVSAGSLPAGLSLNGSGMISGTPTTVQTATFTALVTDSAAQTASQSLSIAVTTSSLTVGTTSLPGSVVGTAYTQSLTAVGGVAPYSWVISSGSLPAGLSLNGSTGVISGTPTTVQAAAFTVTVTDSAAHAASQALSITVTSVPVPSAVPGHPEFSGLCNAWSHGSATGQQHKHQAAGFQGLIQAAGAENLTGSALDAQVTQFCEGISRP